MLPRPQSSYGYPYYIVSVSICVVMSGASRFVDEKIRQRKVMMFAKRRDPACEIARRTLQHYSLTPDVYEVCEIDRRHDCTLIENHFLVICLVSQRCVSCMKTVTRSIAPFLHM